MREHPGQATHTRRAVIRPHDHARTLHASATRRHRSSCSGSFERSKSAVPRVFSAAGARSGQMVQWLVRVAECSGAAHTCIDWTIESLSSPALLRRAHTAPSLSCTRARRASARAHLLHGRCAPLELHGAAVECCDLAICEPFRARASVLDLCTGNLIACVHGKCLIVARAHGRMRGSPHRRAEGSQE